MKYWIGAALVLCGWTLPSAARAATFSMQDVLSAPFADNLTASPDGTVLVWKVHLRGRRNLYTNAGGSIHKITNYDGDDGQDIDDVAITRDNSTVAFMRGGTEDNTADDNINPLSVVPPPVRGVYVVGIGGGTPLLVGEGSQVALSPRGTALAWVNKDGVLNVANFSKAVAGYVAAKADAVDIRGQAQNPVWSPDGTRIAFTNARENHSFVVIYTPATKSYVYATPAFSNDDYAAWSPSGDRVAFVRMPGDRFGESSMEQPPQDPWSVWVADATDGNARMAFEAHRGMGVTFYPTDSPAQLWWMSGDRVAFAWEGDGWRHLYAVPAAGGTPALLTAGPFEVETVAPSLDRASLLYATNEGDIDRRHIWQVGIDGLPHALTAGSRDQWSPTPLANGGYAYVDAGYDVPPAVTLSGATPTALAGEVTPPEFPARDLVRPQLVTFRAPDGLTIHGQLFVPTGAGRHPAIVFDHGGPQRQMLPGFHYMEAYTNLYESNQYLANHGFVVLSINYRGGIMYGHNFRMAPGVDERGASNYQDVLAGARWVQRRSDVDPQRVGIYGLSDGGYLAALGLARNSDVFKAGSDYAGVHDWAALMDWYERGRVVGTPQQRKIAYDASPVAAIATWRSPVFLSQGDDDRNVDFAQGVDLATRLRDRGVHVETMVFPNETHENQVWAHMVRQYEASTKFLIDELKP